MLVNVEIREVEESLDLQEIDEKLTQLFHHIEEENLSENAALDLLTPLNKMFEAELILTKKDPLERAERRRDFYMKQREFIENLDSTKIQTGEKKYDAFGDQRYAPTIKSKELEAEEIFLQKIFESSENTYHNPVFMGHDGQLYDINYLPIRVDEEKLAKRRGKLGMVLNGVLNPFDLIHDPELYQNPPNPKNFSSFEFYEKALSEWSQSVQRNMGYLQLPRPMGRHFYRPSTLEKSYHFYLKLENQKH